MKILEKYQCEICNNIFDEKEWCIDCESKGQFDPSVYPKGLMFAYYHGGFVGIFVLASDAEKYFGHYGYAGCYAARETLGDNLGTHTCGGASPLPFNKEKFLSWCKYHGIEKEHTTKDCFKRVVDYVKNEMKVQPMYYDREGNLRKIL